jgi:S1-C subfamily serine protease
MNVGVRWCTALTIGLTGCVDDGPASAPREVVVRASGCSLVDDLARGIVVADGYVLTVAHALRGARSVSVADAGGVVVATDPRVDAALIAAPIDGPAAKLADQVAVGPATLGGRPIEVVRTVHANVEEPRDDTTYRRQALVLRAEVARGQSGSAVIGPAGVLLGMVFAASNRTDDVSYAVSAVELGPFLAPAIGLTEPVGLGEC